eukprot:6180708-Pleurochrysis_carterae.AAC.2
MYRHFFPKKTGLIFSFGVSARGDLALAAGARTHRQRCTCVDCGPPARCASVAAPRHCVRRVAIARAPRARAWPWRGDLVNYAITHGPGGVRSPRPTSTIPSSWASAEGGWEARVRCLAGH